MMMKIVGVVIVLLLIGGGFFYFRSTQGKAADAEPSVTVTETPTDKPTPEVFERDKYKIQILNGSGIAGEAGRAQELLKDAKFNVISTGNADTYDFEETVIRAGKDVNTTWIDELKDALKRKYKVQSAVEDLTDDSDAEVVVVVGKFNEKGESMAPEEPTAAPTEEAASDEADTTSTPSPSPTGSN